VRFGHFTVDPETRLLLRDGSECHLPPKAFDLLWSLIERRPGVVEKSDLHARLWPDTFVVDGSLNVLVGQVRRALGDDAQRPRFVRTVHGVGYAFCGDAVPAPGEPAGAGQTQCWLIAGEKTYSLRPGENIVGRDPGSTVWVNSPSVSRRHARLVVDTGSRRLTVEDLGSRNGTYVGREPVRTTVELTDDAAITFGSVETRLHLWNSDTASATKRIPRKRR
jgi:DNA-binding winged helix-turn-helix (wHTH) protein